MICHFPGPQYGNHLRQEEAAFEKLLLETTAEVAASKQVGRTPGGAPAAADAPSVQPAAITMTTRTPTCCHAEVGALCIAQLAANRKVIGHPGYGNCNFGIRQQSKGPHLS